MAEIPCHAVKSPFEEARQPGGLQLRASTASCNTSGLAERDLAVALPRARASRERITFSTGSLLKDSKKRQAACTRPTPSLPAGPSAPPQHRPGGQSHGKPRASPKESCKIPNGWHRHRHRCQALKWRFANVSGCPRNQEPIRPRAYSVTTLFQDSVSPPVNREAPFLYTFL